MQSKKYNQKEILMKKKIKYIIKRRQKKVIYIWENNTKPTKMKGKKVEKVDLYKLLPYYYEGKNFKKQNSEKKIKTKPENAPYFLTETINANHNNKNDYQNTNGLVANLVQNSMRLKSYMFRKNRMKDLLEHKIPNLEEYDRILMNKFQKIKEMRHNKNRELNEKQNINYLSKKQLLNYKVEKSIEMLGEKEKE